MLSKVCVVRKECELFIYRIRNCCKERLWVPAGKERP